MAPLSTSNSCILTPSSSFSQISTSNFLFPILHSPLPRTFEFVNSVFKLSAISKSKIHSFPRNSLTSICIKFPKLKTPIPITEYPLSSHLKSVNPTAEVFEIDFNSEPESLEAEPMDSNFQVPTKPFPRVLSIAGSDSGSGAGIQADLKACSSCGVYCSTAITALTAQNTVGVQKVHVAPPDFVGEQIRSVLSDIGTDVIKTGMLPTVEIIDEICSVLKSSSYKALVVDPVMISTSGDRLANLNIISSLKQNLLPLADLVTPNLFESSALIGSESQSQIQTLEDMKNAAVQIHALGPKNVLIKGGHLPNSKFAIDILYDGNQFFEFKSPFLNATNSHGTGCTLSSIIAAELAKGQPMINAIQIAKKQIYELLFQSQNFSIGKGSQKPLSYFSKSDFSLIKEILEKNESNLKKFHAKDLLLYAVTDSKMNKKWKRNLKDAVLYAIKGGATFLQIREKDLETGEFIKEAKEAVAVAKRFGIPIVINDRVDVALACDADGVHVGQSDMPVATVRKILGPDKIIGLSVKSPDQAIDGYLSGADYFGVGGVYTTNTKQNNTTIGLAGLFQVCETSQVPVVAIGGIKANNVAEVLGLRHPKLFGVAVVSVLFDQFDVEESTRVLRATINDVI